MASRRGGVREGAGRKPQTGQVRAHRVVVLLDDAEYAEALDAAGDRALAVWFRDSAFAWSRGLKRSPPR